MVHIHIFGMFVYWFCFAQCSKVVDKVDMSSYRAECGAPGSYRIQLCTRDNHREGVGWVLAPDHGTSPFPVCVIVLSSNVMVTSGRPARCGRELRNGISV